MTSDAHEREVALFVEKLNKEGWTCISLSGIKPDAIAVRGNLIFAVEILADSGNKAKKRKDYARFDGVLFHEFSIPFKEVKNSIGSENKELKIFSKEAYYRNTGELPLSEE